MPPVGSYQLFKFSCRNSYRLNCSRVWTCWCSFRMTVDGSAWDDARTPATSHYSYQHALPYYSAAFTPRTCPLPHGVALVVVGPLFTRCGPVRQLYRVDTLYCICVLVLVHACPSAAFPHTLHVHTFPDVPHLPSPAPGPFAVARAGSFTTPAHAPLRLTYTHAHPDLHAHAYYQLPFTTPAYAFFFFFCIQYTPQFIY